MHCPTSRAATSTLAACAGGQGAESVAVRAGDPLFFLAHAHLRDGAERTLSKLERLTAAYRELDGLDHRDAHSLASGVLTALKA